INRYQLKGTFYPFSNEQADQARKIISKFTLKPVSIQSAKLTSNIMDGKSLLLSADNLDEVTMVIDEIKVGSRKKRCMLGFKADSILNLNQNDPDSAILLGYSGTESLHEADKTFTL